MRTMKYIIPVLLVMVMSVPSAALIQTGTSGNYSIVLSISPDIPVVNTPTHMELHIQILSGDTASDLNVEELIVHTQEHTSAEPHIQGENISGIHVDNPHRTFLDMKANHSEPPGHYHVNYTFGETGMYEVVVQFRNNNETVTSIFPIDVKPEQVKREPLKIWYNIFGIIAASFLIFAALVYAIRKISDIFNIK